MAVLYVSNFLFYDRFGIIVVSWGICLRRCCMYYIVSYIIYFLTLLILFRILRKPGDIDGAKAKDRFVTEMYKGLSKSDLKNRKKRVKSLRLYERFLYRLWFTFCIILLFAVPLLLIALRIFIQKKFYIPNFVIFYSNDSIDTPSAIVLLFGGMFLGAVISVGFSYLTYTDTIRKADKIYQTGSFQTYPFKFNIFMSFIIVLIVFPIMITSFNCYLFCTEDEIVEKSAFSLNENRYEYSNVSYIEQKTYTDDKIEYIAFMDNGKKLTIYDGFDDEAVLNVLHEYNIDIHQIVVKGLFPN